MPRYQYAQTQTHRLIQAILHNWNSLFNGTLLIGSEQAFSWIEEFPLDIIDIGMRVSCEWYRRMLTKGVNVPSADGVARYASKVMTNKTDARDRYQRMMNASESSPQ
jgi:hypothetical protein